MKRANNKAQGMTVPVAMSQELHQKLEEASAKTTLSKQDLIRLSMGKGLELVVKALTLTADELASLPDRPVEPANAAA